MVFFLVARNCDCLVCNIHVGVGSRDYYYNLCSNEGINVSNLIN